MTAREYIKIPKPNVLPKSTVLLRELNDEVWQNLVFYHLLSFYKKYDSNELKSKIAIERKKAYPRIEREIAKYVRKYLRNNRDFSLNLCVVGELTNDEEIEGNYDIVIGNTYWRNSFFFECKNLTSKQNSIDEYVFVRSKKDGGIYRYFNGKYAVNQSFGGMLGFILDGQVALIRNKIAEAIKVPFDITPEGDFIGIDLDSIEGNDFSFSSTHSRKGDKFKLYHILFDFQ